MTNAAAELTCPECGAVFLFLTARGACPRCLAPLFARYFALTHDGVWLPDPGDDEQRGALIVGSLKSQGAQVRLISQLTWW